eukprot:5798209-Ditylum_brightwellii.AAC.1
MKNPSRLYLLRLKIMCVLGALLMDIVVPFLRWVSIFGEEQQVPKVLEKAVPMAFHVASRLKISSPEKDGGKLSPVVGAQNRQMGA